MRNVILAVVLSVLASVLAVKLWVVPQAGGEAHKETAYERVMRTGVLRCGYLPYEPITMKDPNTGELSGILYDIMNEIGRRTGLKVEWSSELNLATYLEDMKNGRFDVECSGGWPRAERGKFAAYTMPLFYMPNYFYARAGDIRFDNNLEVINDPQIRVATMPGELGETMRNLVYPLSTNVSIAPTSAWSDLLAQIRYGKADLVLYDVLSANAYMRENPGVLRRVDSEPVALVTNNISVAKDELLLRDMLDTASEELLNSGFVEQTLRKYGVADDVALRVVKPYKEPSK